MSDDHWYLYLIRCGDNSLYTGITKDVARRVEEHRSGTRKAAKYLRGKAPLTLAWQYRVQSQSQALKLEQRIKRLPKYDKERLAAGQLLVESLEATDAPANSQNPI